MRVLLFLSKVAFVSNICFLLSALLQWSAFIQNHIVVSTIVTIGYFLAVFLFNPLVNIIYLVFLFQKKLWSSVPKWLVVANFTFLIAQILFIILLNDSFYNQGQIH